jgi:hypothetical protein
MALQQGVVVAEDVEEAHPLRFPSTHQIVHIAMSVTSQAIQQQNATIGLTTPIKVTVILQQPISHHPPPLLI